MAFSATLPNDVESLCNKYMENPTKFRISITIGIISEAIEHHVIEVKEKDKISLLKTVTPVGNPDSCIIFCRTKDHVDTLFAELEKSKYSLKGLIAAWNEEIVLAL